MSFCFILFLTCISLLLLKVRALLKKIDLFSLWCKRLKIKFQHSYWLNIWGQPNHGSIKVKNMYKKITWVEMPGRRLTGTNQSFEIHKFLPKEMSTVI